MKRIFLFSILLLVVSTITRAQAPQLVKLTPPSPNAAAFQKYGEIPVSAYTGVPDISIPMYTLHFRDIAIPINLSYHASGIKVNEESSQVGLGWIINAGGCISRNIIGSDDFIGTAYFNSTLNELPDLTYNHGPTNFMAHGCKLPRFNRNIPQNPTLDTLDLTNYLEGNYDFQPDQYFYNFLGHSGKFLLKRDRTAVIQKAEKMEITCLDGQGNAFRVRDLSGFTYDFAVYEINYDAQFNYDHHTAWYLTRITSPSGNSVSYNYSSSNNRVYTQGSYSITRDDYSTPLIFSDMQWSGTAFPIQQGMAPSRSYSSLLLDNIDFTNGIVKFFYSDRTDVQGEKMLDSVSVYARDAQGVLSTTPLKTISLTHDYFDYGAFDNDWGGDLTYSSKRLKLSQVLEKGYYGGVLASANPYVFTYNESIHLPSKNSFARDHWGYYNGRTTNSSLIPSYVSINSPDQITHILGGQGPERDPDPAFMQAYSLTSIQYPTGGSTELQYEANDFDEKLSQVNDNTYFSKNYTIIQQTQTIGFDNIGKHFTTTDTLDLRNEYLFINNLGLNSSYYVHMLARFRFSGQMNCSTNFPPGQISFSIYDATGTTSLVSKDMNNFSACSGGASNNCMICQSQAGVISYNTDLILPPGKYVIRFFAASAYNTSLQDVAWTFSYYTKEGTPASYSSQSNTYTIGGGLRIKRIIDHDGFDPANDKVKRFMYHYQTDNNNDGIAEEYSYGKRMSKPGYSYFRPVWMHIEYCDLVCHHWFGWSSHLMRSSDSNIPLSGSAGGAVVGYDRVTVLEGENGENGKTVYQYINVPDIINPYNDNNGLPIRPPFGSAIPEQLNGSLIKQIEYTADGKKVKEVTNTYTSQQDNENTIFGMEPRADEKYIADAASNALSTDLVLPCDQTLVSYWSQKSVWNCLSSSNEKLYASGDDSKFLETTTSYFYDEPSHLLPTRVVTSNSKGEIITTRTAYPLSYTISTASDALAQGIVNLQSRHIINSPIEKYVQIANSDGSNTRITSGIVTAYGSALPLPAIAYTTETTSPILNFTALAINSGNASLDIRYQPKIYFDRYDGYGNLVQQHKANDIPSAYIWDYNSSLPIAECTNATSGEIAYTSFEWDGTGNWSGISSVFIQSTGGVTGSKCYSQNNFSISKSGLNASKEYTVSYWSKNGAYSVTGTQAGYPKALLASSINGITWGLFEHLVTGQNVVTISGSGAIDELRLYPKNALMSTYCYTPLVGINTLCNPGNHLSFYEYDGLGRLQLVRDQDYNILKKYEYKYAAANK
jgi:hypothetical protein